jgi:hypothetical protein
LGGSLHIINRQKHALKALSSLAIFHNIVFLTVRFIQARMDLDFLPMIRHVLLWIGFVLFGYLSWISFNHGAKFGEFHTWSLLILPIFSFCLGLGCLQRQRMGCGTNHSFACCLVSHDCHSFNAGGKSFAPT